MTTLILSNVLRLDSEKCSLLFSFKDEMLSFLDYHTPLTKTAVQPAELFIPAGHHLISLIILPPEIAGPVKSLLIRTMLH